MHACRPALIYLENLHSHDQPQTKQWLAGFTLSRQLRHSAAYLGY